jgi:hypothetical protein
MRKPFVLAAALLACLVASLAPAPSGADPGFQVVASGLDNPRQLTFAPGGDLYVAEAGSGGLGGCVPGGEGALVCSGDSGAVTCIQHGRQSRVLSGLPSLANDDGTEGIGPSDVSMTGRNRLVVSFGFGADPALRRGLARSGRLLGTLHEYDLALQTERPLADLASYEAAANPVDGPDSDPTGLVRAGGGYLVTDSGGNDLLHTTRSGHVSTVAALPDRDSGRHAVESVPTDVVRGPDGAFYVSQLTGFPFRHGAANIYRVVPGQQPTVYASGLTNVTSLAFTPDGTLYAVQLSDEGLLDGTIGSLVRVAPDGAGATTETVRGGLFAPYGVALWHGDAYVTVGSSLPHDGQVLRIPLG